MSLGIVVKGSEGIVLAADSRLTVGAQIMVLQQKPNTPAPVQVPQQIFVNFDNAAKLLTFADPNKWIGAVTYGAAVIGTKPNDLRTAQSFIPEFEGTLSKDRQTVRRLAEQLSVFFMERWTERGMPPADKYSGQGMSFSVAGYDIGRPYGSVYTLSIPKMPNPIEQAVNDFGINIGGQAEHSVRLISGFDPRVLQIAKATFQLSDDQVKTFQGQLAQLTLGIPYALLPLQDCIDLAVFLVHTTVAAQKLSIGIRGVGGTIDVAVVTRREPLRFVQRKELLGEIPTGQKK
jgi:hypothetical protein